MIRLQDIDERNWMQVAGLTVHAAQAAFLAPPISILARGYVYRVANARVWAIAHGGEIVGVAMVRDMEEEPRCYELQQFMIDRRFQNMGIGTEALRQILALLRAEARYDCVEVCVHSDAHAALHVYEKVGFEDTGYVDAAVPDCRNLRYCFCQP